MSRTVEVGATSLVLLSDEARKLDIQGTVYQVVDVYIPGEGAASVFLNRGQSVEHLVGFRIGVYKNRLSVNPVFDE